MIAVSGAFVAAALVLLVVGLVSSGLTVVYASILASVVSAAFLIAGVLQLHRRDTALPPDVDDAPAPRRLPATASPNDGDNADNDGDNGGGRIGPTMPGGRPGSAGVPAGGRPPPVGAAGTPTAGIVFVVAGQPLYHSAACPRLGAAEPEPLEVEDALATGYTACPVCHPDEHLTDPAALLGAGWLSGEGAGPGGEVGEIGTSEAAPPAPAPGTDRVLALSAQGRYHLPGCHYLPPGASRVTTRASAEAEGLAACGLCGG